MALAHLNDPINTTHNQDIKRAQQQLKDKDYEGAKQTLCPLVDGITANHWNDVQVYALLLLGDAHRSTGEMTQAYKCYVTATELKPELEEKLRQTILAVVYLMPRALPEPVFEKHLRQCIESPEHDNGLLNRLVVELLHEKWHLKDEDAQLELGELLQDSFFLLAVENCVLADPYTENFLVQLRKILLTTLLTEGMNRLIRPMVIALAKHSELTEHVAYIDKQEQDILSGLRQVIQSHVKTPEDFLEIEHLLLAIGMYEALTQLPAQRLLEQLPVATWPVDTRDYLIDAVYNRFEEARIEKTIDTIAPIQNKVSKDVMSQYQENPYPRWKHLQKSIRNANYASRFSYLNAFLPERRHNKKLKTLVAGCGTGKHPLWLAQNCKDLDILAIDLSMPSLAYAKRQADKLGMNYVQFKQGDILDAGKIKGKFDLIECVGVLHHMENPDAGLSALLGKLAKDGVLHIGLYSRIARDLIGVNATRTENQQLNRGADISTIRQVRKDYLDKPDAFPFQSLDFFSLSECRDLLFHVQEHQYDIPMIAQWLESHDLEFIGWTNLFPDILNHYSKVFPEDTNRTNLDNWQKYEEANPDLFKAMYQFHCVRKGSVHSARK